MAEKKAVDKAFKLFHDKKYKDAADAFSKLLGKEDVPEWQKARLKQFHKISVDAQGVEGEPQVDSIKEVSFHLNHGAFQEAADMIGRTELPADTQAYLKAEISIEQGDRERAVELLKEAVELNEDNAGYALNSPSFAEYIKEEDFLFLRSEVEPVE